MAKYLDAVLPDPGELTDAQWERRKVGLLLVADLFDDIHLIAGAIASLGKKDG